MLSLKVISAGTGYEYYTSEMVSGDELRADGYELGDYYHARGLPPGQWIGDGCATLGVSGNVSKEQMANLMGMGIHPDAERIRAEAIAEGKTPKQAEAETLLGRKYYEYEAKTGELATRIKTAEDDFKRLNQREPRDAEKRKIHRKEGAKLFRERHGRGPDDNEELAKFITGQLRPQQSAVAGFDMTMTPVKSVSVLWAVGGDDARKLVERAQHEAVKDTVSWLQEHAVRTRTGANGVAQEDVPGGIVAQVFRHYDSREGDPNLHDHLVISNKVQTADGKWKTIDSRLLHKMSVSASEHYNARIQAHLAARGVQFEARGMGPGKQPVMEVKGISAELLEEFSTRRATIREELDRLADEYAAKFGHAPGKEAMLKLAQQATLETRAAKKSGRSLEELVTEWRSRAASVVGERTLGRLAERVIGAREARQAAQVDVAAAARELVAVVEAERAVWGQNHLEAAAQRWAKEYSLENGSVASETVREIIGHALTHEAQRVTPERAHATFEPLTRADGSSVFEHKGSILYASEGLIRAENYLLRAGQREVIPVASPDVFHAVIAERNARVAAGEAFPLSPAQMSMAFEFTVSDKLVSVGKGPAGTGKSTAMEVVRDVVQRSGGNVIALAPQAVAATLLGDKLGIRGMTADAFAIGSGTVAPGDLVILDEAGMCGTKLLADVVERAETAGARIALLGDDAQIGAVAAGGAFGMLAAELGAVELDTIHRFEDPEEAQASLALRRRGEGETDPFAWYREHGRVQAGDGAMVEALAFRRWQEAHQKGTPAVVMAATNEQAQRLSERAQAALEILGEIDTSRDGRTLRDGSKAWAGDTIVTRRNEWIETKSDRVRVHNGDLWRVEKVNRDGTLTVRHQGDGKRTTLPGDYIEQNVHLGYAYTTHRAQGMTVTAGIPIVSASTARNLVYVAMTRGEVTNQLYVQLEDGQTLEEVLGRIAANEGIERSVHQAMADEHTRIDSTDQLAAEYRHVSGLADELRFKGMAHQALGPMATMFTASDAWGAVSTHLAVAEADGFDPRALLVEAVNMRSFEGAEDAAAVLAWRIEGLLAKAPENATPKHASLATQSEESLYKALKVAEDREAKALAHRQSAIAAQHGPWPKEHWTNRPFGHLTEAAIESRIRADRLLARTDATLLTKEQRERLGVEVPAKDARKLSWEIRALQDELRHRKGLDPAQDVAELAERGHANRKAAGAGHFERHRQSHEIAAAIRDELRRRQLVPDPAKAAQAAPDRLPEWAAPHQAAADEFTPANWRSELNERRAVLTARFEETGHLIAAEPPAWAAGLGPVPADPERAQRWRETAAEVAAFRDRYKIPAAETAPIPERFRDHPTGAELHTRTVSLARGTNSAPAPAEETTMAAQKAVERAAATHAPKAQAQRTSDKDRTANGQDATSVTATQRAKDSLAALNRLRDQQEALRRAEQKPRRKDTPGGNDSGRSDERNRDRGRSL
ncbi:MobF family relaxase [Sinomonas sp. ASV322]|uniref:MobF family relaxase n=1 Tax=Sinomonas sp. ASV322 TaxID=3041920 RepID=UPI0027DABA56|nr:MobF family relaxase [Sinomonas sp. ASV322]MDQ4504443.1 MobF family relaxase [Sinomonas sp. ASV322]